MTIKLEAQPRTVKGKKVKALRREGLVPAEVYGKDFDNLSIQVGIIELSKALSDAGTTNLISLDIEGANYDVLVKDIVRSLDRKTILHADLYHVNKNIVIKATVPITLVGESPLSNAGGIPVSSISEIEVMCLPNEIPSEYEIDISGLEDFSQVITVADLVVGDNVEMVTSPTTTLAYIASTRASREEEAADAEAAAEASAEGESAKASQDNEKSEE